LRLVVFVRWKWRAHCRSNRVGTFHLVENGAGAESVSTWRTFGVNGIKLRDFSIR
jgi:hypothetical protein